MRAGDFYQIATDLALEHGPVALDYARRATLQFECEGEAERARFWFAISVLLGDIVEHRLDPHAPITFH